MADTSDASPPSGTADERGSARVLVVDDDRAIGAALDRFLRLRGYEVDTAGNGDSALELLHRNRYAVMICDVRMPGMSGLDLLPDARATDPDLAVIMLTAVNDAPTATTAISRGAMDYLTKPVELGTLEHAVQRVRRRRDLMIHQRQVDHLIREEVEARTAELEREKATLRDLTVRIVETLINAMEAKDPYMRGRSHRVSELSATVADELGLGVDTVEAVRLAARLIDVGRIGIRESVLNKPGPLTSEEYAHVKEHVRIGLDILTPLQHLGPVLDYVLDHHERFDGSGYPRGLAGEAISIGGRIIAAADAFDAITTGRAHQDAVSPDQAITYLREHAGTLLDPRVYDALRVVVARHKSLTFIEAVPA
ncbi:MAG TPA: HD domain-containing phosphohydrolase [Gemmatimonadaceae bacterium]